VPSLEAELQKLELQATGKELWADTDRARRTLAEAKRLRGLIEPVRHLESRLVELQELEALARAEEDAATLADVQRDLAGLESKLDGLEFRLLLGGEDDPKNALLTIHPGAGGTESLSLRARDAPVELRAGRLLALRHHSRSERRGGAAPCGFSNRSVTELRRFSPSD